MGWTLASFLFSSGNPKSEERGKAEGKITMPMGTCSRTKTISRVFSNNAEPFRRSRSHGFSQAVGKAANEYLLWLEVVTRCQWSADYFVSFLFLFIPVCCSRNPRTGASCPGILHWNTGNERKIYRWWKSVKISTGITHRRIYNSSESVTIHFFRFFRFTCPLQFFVLFFRSPIIIDRSPRQRQE